MRVRIGDYYLEYEGDIDIEKKIKLFEAIDATEGDFSYQFEVFLTANNIRALGIPFADNKAKRVYNNINCALEGEDGLELYRGYLRIEGVKNDIAKLSFWSGNNNWFSMITGNLSDLDYSGYDLDLTLLNIVSTWNETSGLVLPVIDSGTVSYRSNRDLVLEDFKGFLFVKEVMLDIFQAAGIKLQGEILSDFRYNNLIVTSNDLALDNVKARSFYAQKTSDQVFALGDTKITFTNDSVPPFYDGSEDNYDSTLSRYTADVDMVVKFESSIQYNLVDGGVGLTALVNGVTPYFVPVNAQSATIRLNAGDYVEYFASFFSPGGSPSLTILSGSTLKITPLYIYKVFANAILPKWTKGKFVSEILKMFCTISEFDNYTKTLTINLFENIKNKPAVDLSEYISEVEEDYSEFINSYGRNNILSYTESDVEVIGQDDREVISEGTYNNSNNVPYGAGNIEVNNDFIEDSFPLLESDFSAPFTYIQPAFDMSFEKLDLIEQKENSDIKAEITGVADVGGLAQFSVSADVYTVGDVVKIENSTVQSYNGYWVVSGVSAGFLFVNTLLYNGNATGDSVKMDLTLSNSSNTYLLLKSNEIDMGDYLSGYDSLYVSNLPVSDFAVGYFNMIDNNKEATNKLLYGLSFGRSSNDLQFQIPLIDSYWSVVARVFNDPVKLICKANVPDKVFRNISFLNPVTIRTKETSNLYYLNRITGYKGSHLPCTKELIKLP